MPTNPAYPWQQPDETREPDEFDRLGGSSNTPLDVALRNAFRKVFGRQDAEAAAARRASGRDEYDELGGGATDPLSVAMRGAFRRAFAQDGRGGPQSANIPQGSVDPISQARADRPPVVPAFATDCDSQYRSDTRYCGGLHPQLIRPCRAQASERYAACLAGRPIPPMPF